MIARQQLKSEIDRLDEHYLELVFKIIRQFPRASDKPKAPDQKQQIVAIFQEIADAGGLGISDPAAWQRDIRQDRALPFRRD